MDGRHLVQLEVTDVDVRYWGTDLSDEGCTVRSGFSNGCDSRVVATISFDTSWSAVRDWSRKIGRLRS